VGDVVVDARSTWRASRVEFERVEFLTVSEAVTAASQKEELFRRTAAGVVEMENEKVRKLAAAYSLPFLGIRAVSDGANDSIDPAVLGFIDPFGAVKINEVISEMVRRPSIIKKLRNLSKASAAALDRLAEGVREVIDGPGTV
jgi:nucleoside phosphorylase